VEHGGEIGGGGDFETKERVLTAVNDQFSNTIMRSFFVYHVATELFFLIKPLAKTLGSKLMLC
jgi:hypothetical protein